MILNRKIYWSLILGIFLSSVALPHGGAIPVVILEILGLVSFLSSGEIDFQTLAIIIAALALQLLIIILGRKELKSYMQIWMLAAAILFLNGLTIFALLKQGGSNEAKVFLFSSGVLFLASGITIFNLFKTKLPLLKA